jgi:multicomponent Na+:H+ antiporter subunit F
MNGIETLAFVLIALAALMSVYRLIVGPTNPDRIVSADALSLIATVSLIMLTLAFDSPLYIDVALIYSMLAFVGIIAIARVIKASPKSKPVTQGKGE